MSRNQETHQQPTCEQCSAGMVYVGKLPSSMHRPAEHVFRCNSCDAIVRAKD